MTGFETIRNDYPDWDSANPADWPGPTSQDIEKIQSDFGLRYPQAFIDFQRTECHRTPMGDFAFDNFGWACASLGPMHKLKTIVADARQAGVPPHLAPFKHDNGYYFCSRHQVRSWFGITTPIESNRTEDIDGLPSRNGCAPHSMMNAPRLMTSESWAGAVRVGNRRRPSRR